MSSNDARMRLERSKLQSEISFCNKTSEDVFQTILDNCSTPKSTLKAILYSARHDPDYQLGKLVQHGFIETHNNRVTLTAKGAMAAKFRQDILTPQSTSAHNLHSGHLEVLVNLLEGPKSTSELRSVLAKETRTIRNDLAELRKEQFVESFRVLDSHRMDARGHAHKLTEKGMQISTYFLASRLSDRIVRPEIVPPWNWMIHIWNERPSCLTPSTRVFLGKSRRRLLKLKLQNELEAESLRVSEFEWWPGRKMFRLLTWPGLKIEIRRNILNSFEPLQDLNNDSLDIATMGIETVSGISGDLIRGHTLLVLIHFSNGFPIVRVKQEARRQRMTFNKNSMAEKHLVKILVEKSVVTVGGECDSHEDVVKAVIGGDANVFPARHPLYEVWDLTAPGIECLGFLPFDMALVTDEKNFTEKPNVIAAFMKALERSFELFRTPEIHGDLAYEYANEINPFHSLQVGGKRVRRILEMIVRSR